MLPDAFRCFSVGMEQSDKEPPKKVLVARAAAPRCTALVARGSSGSDVAALRRSHVSHL